MNYELTIALEPNLKGMDDFLAKVEKTVEAVGGKIESKEDWGVKNLAYPLGKHETAQYYFFRLNLTGAGAKSLQEKIRVMTEPLRFLIILVEQIKKK